MNVLRVTKINLLRWRDDPKYLAVAVYMVMYMWFLLRGVCDYAELLGTDIHPWIFPFLMRGNGIITSLMLGFVILISDAPFRSSQQRFVLLRTGKRTWLAGQILYLLLLSAAFTALLFLLSLLFVLPKLRWSTEWGSFLTTIAVTGLPGTYGAIDARYSVMNGIGAVEATLWTVAEMISVCFLLGMIMLLCNLWLGKGVGMVAVCTFVILPTLTFIFQATPYVYRYLTWISPMNWVDRSVLGHTGQHLPSYTYAMVMPVALSLLLTVVAMTTIHRNNLDTDKE